MAQRLKAHITVKAENISFGPRTHSSQLPVTPAPGHPNVLLASRGTCIHVWMPTYRYMQVHIIKNKINLKNKNRKSVLIQ